MKRFIGLALMLVTLIAIAGSLRIVLMDEKSNASAPPPPAMAPPPYLLPAAAPPDAPPNASEEDVKAQNTLTRRIPEGAVNLLPNPHFLASNHSWEYFRTHDYITWSPLGHLNVGALRIAPSAGGSSEAWRGGWQVNPGDKVIYAGWFRAGPAGTRQWNNGAGLGWDLRAYGDHEIFYTLNGPSTLSDEWTYLYTEQVIPCLGRMDGPADFWYSTDNTSGTLQGARAGLWDTPSIRARYENRPMPAIMTLVVWVHIWHKDTVEWAEADDLELYVVRDAISC